MKNTNSYQKKNLQITKQKTLKPLASREIPTKRMAGTAWRRAAVGTEQGRGACAEGLAAAPAAAAKRRARAGGRRFARSAVEGEGRAARDSDRCATHEEHRADRPRGHGRRTLARHARSTERAPGGGTPGPRRVRHAPLLCGSSRNLQLHAKCEAGELPAERLRGCGRGWGR